MGIGASSSTGLPPPLLNTPGVGGVLCAKHHCFTRASCNSDEGSSFTSGDIGPVGDDRLLLGVDDEDDEAEVLREEVSEGGSGEATLGGVDRGEERGDVNMGIPSLKMGAEMAIRDLISFYHDQNKGKHAYFSASAPDEVQTAGIFLPSCPNDSLEGWEFGWEK